MGLVRDVISLIKANPAEARASSKPKQQWSWDKPGSYVEFFDRMLSTWSEDTSVTQDNILSLDAWWRGVRVISDSISGLPVNVYQRTKDGAIEERRDHVAYSILNIETSPSQSHFTWKSGVIDSTLNTGDSFSYIIRDRTKRVKYLIPIWPGLVSEWKVDGKYNLSWKIQGIDGWVSDKDVFHTMGFSHNGITGLNPVEVHRLSLSAAMGTTMYAEKLMRNGAFLSGVIETENPLNDKQRDQIENSWQGAYGGVANSAKVAILDRGMTYKPLVLSPADAGWLGMRKDLTTVVSRILGVPMHMLSVLDDATYSNIEQQSQDFERYSLRPWIERLESEIRRKLFTEEEIADGYFVSFDTEPLIQGDLIAQAQYNQTMFNIGAFNQNEIRAKSNKGPIDGGDRYYIQGNNMVPTDRIDEVIDSNVRNKSLSEGMRDKKD